ncbi:hypothetical protein B484DRAFT_332452, partial [Ochromonadaceae sp. CCMP2298]
GSVLDAQYVLLSVGHSARGLYHKLHSYGVTLQTKAIAAGFRIEHPQELINAIQYGEFGKLCNRGQGPVPVADYSVATEVFLPSSSSSSGSSSSGGRGSVRTCYSFCMCPGGQIVPTSVNPDELCINGMSFSKRQSRWANSALVVNINPEDMVLMPEHCSLPGSTPGRVDSISAAMGGGDLVCPVARVTDFLAGGLSGGIISSSYRLGVKESPLHMLYPDYVNQALRRALMDFDRKMPGFISPEAILHGVETRTSAPVQILRHKDTLECASLRGLFPSGEGAGYAGGIVSAAVDGLKCAR